LYRVNGKSLPTRQQNRPLPAQNFQWISSFDQDLGGLSFCKSFPEGSGGFFVQNALCMDFPFCGILNPQIQYGHDDTGGAFARKADYGTWGFGSAYA
jgi:hypothetical protein